MKKTLITVASLFLSFTAYADTVNITTEAAFSGPTSSQSSKIAYAFTPTTSPIVFNVAGKTCSWVSSTQAIGPQGCNYSITISPNGTLTNPSNANSTSSCTQASAMVAACK